MGGAWQLSGRSMNKCSKSSRKKRRTKKSAVKRKLRHEGEMSQRKGIHLQSAVGLLERRVVLLLLGEATLEHLRGAGLRNGIHQPVGKNLEAEMVAVVEAVVKIHEAE